MKSQDTFYQVQVKNEIASGGWGILMAIDRYSVHPIEFQIWNESFGLTEDDHLTPEDIRRGIDDGLFRIVKMKRTLEILDIITAIDRTSLQ